MIIEYALNVVGLKFTKDRGIKKIHVCSWIEVDKRVHDFLVRDRSHLQTQETYNKK